MTLWASAMLISPWQMAYAIGLVVLFGRRGPTLIAWVLLADFLIILGIMAAMDFGLLVREQGNDQVTASVLVVWCVTAAIMVTQPGLGRVLAVLSVLGITAFSATLFWGVQVSTTSAIVNTVALFQLAVACFGSSGDDSGDGRRVSSGQVCVEIPSRVEGVVFGGVAQGASLLSADCGE